MEDRLDWNDSIEYDGTTYQENFLQSKWWKTERAEKLKRHGSKCHCCHSETNIRVHHTSYKIKNKLDKMGFDYSQAFDVENQYQDFWNLDVLCQPCHDIYHKAERIMFRLLKYHDRSIQYYEDIISRALYEVFPNGWTGKYPIVFVKLLMDRLREYLETNDTDLTFSGVQYGSIVKNANNMRGSNDNQ